jgi:hypothetical protein
MKEEEEEEEKKEKKLTDLAYQRKVASDLGAVRTECRQ